MAAPCPLESSTSAASKNVANKAEPVSVDDAPLGARDVTARREPVVTLSSPASGPEPLSWSQDHRVAVCTSGSMSLLELVCDVNSDTQDLVLHRSSIPVPADACKLRVGPSAELARAVEKFSSHPDPSLRQRFLADSVINPSLGVAKGMKFASWSPLGCDSSGRCLLACLTLDNRLNVYSSCKRLEWNLLVDLTRRYGERLKERAYASKDEPKPEKALTDLEELRRRFGMQTPLRMEWSSVYAVKQLQGDNSCVDVELVFLAVLMENGDLVLWKFPLPFASGDDVEFYDLIESGVSRPSNLAWWEYDNADRRMSGLIVGSETGPVKIMPVSLAKVRGYFTLRHPVVLWKESDQLAVAHIKCVPLVHPIRKTSCSLIVASRGSYIFWCLLMISATGLNVQKKHEMGLHSLPVVSLAVSRCGVAVYTCAIDGWVKKLTPMFTENSMFFKVEDLLQPENQAGRRVLGMALSCSGAYLALVSTQGMVDGLHTISKTHQVHFLTMKAPETASALLLKSPSQNLFKVTDLLDLLRWDILKKRCIPEALQAELDKKLGEGDSAYLWRLKLFLARVFLQALRSDIGLTEVLAPRQSELGPLSEVETLVATVETQLMRENMKKVLGSLYLNPWIPQTTVVPISGLIDYLTMDPNDRASEVLVHHIRNKMNKQTSLERCSLCQAALPFTDHRRATCENGHVWLRCTLSYRACQTLTFRRCLLQDSIARLPEPDDPEWMKKILQAPCVLCDSPMV